MSYFMVAIPWVHFENVTLCNTATVVYKLCTDLNNKITSRSALRLRSRSCPPWCDPEVLGDQDQSSYSLSEAPFPNASVTKEKFNMD